MREEHEDEHHLLRNLAAVSVFWIYLEIGQSVKCGRRRQRRGKSSVATSHYLLGCNYRDVRPLCTYSRPVQQCSSQISEVHVNRHLHSSMADSFLFYDISSRGTFLHGDNNISQQLSDKDRYNTRLSTILKGRLCQLRKPAPCFRLLEAVPRLSTTFKSPECLEKGWQFHFRFLKLMHQEKQCWFLSSIIPKTFERLTLLLVPQNSLRLLHSLSTQYHFSHSP